MRNIRGEINELFEALGRLTYRNSRLFLSLVVLSLLFPASQLPRLTVDTSTEGFFYDDDPALVAFHDFREQFGRDSLVLITIKSPAIFNLRFLEKLRAFHEELEENVPYVEEVISLINATSIRGEGGELVIEGLMERWPETENDLRMLRERALSNVLFKNMLISEDGRYTTVVVRSVAYLPTEEENTSDGEADLIPLSDKENGTFVQAIREIVDAHRGEDVKMYLAGSPCINYYLMTKLLEEGPVFTLSAIFIIAILLFFLFQRACGIFIPLTIVILSLISVVGAMAFFQTPLTVVTQILPAFIIAVGVGASVHLLVIFFQQFQESGDKEEAIVHAMGHSGLPMLLTSLTTAAGLLSFSNAEIAPVSDLGLFAALGVMLALIYTLLLVPALLSLFPIKQKIESRGNHLTRWIDSALSGMGNSAIQRPRTIVLFSLLLALGAGYCSSLLIFSHDPLSWLPPGNALRKDTELIDKEMRGSISVEVVVDTKKENRLFDPDFMNTLERANREIEKMRSGNLFVGKSTSLVDFLKQIHQALNENRQEFYTVPQRRDLIAQELFLFSNGGADDLEKVTDSRFSKARITIKLPWLDANSYSAFLERLDTKLTRLFGTDVDLTITGMTPLLAKTIFSLIKTMFSSYLIAGLVITIMMILLLGNIKIGLISMIPNFLPIIMGLGLMGILEFRLDLSSVLIGSIAIGLAVDDTVHFMHNFRRYYRELGTPEKAVTQTFHTTGRALVFTTLILCSGCLVFTLSSLSNLVHFGIITSFVLVMALLADLLLSPALMVLAAKWGLDI